MMMNLRGLIMDDPDNTTHLHTLQLITYSNSDSETKGTGSTYTQFTAHKAPELRYGQQPGRDEVKADYDMMVLPK
jgi:hypothetical protein